MKKSITTIVAGAAIFLASASTASADPGICHNGILSDDAGQGCSDGLYNQTHGSRSSGSSVCTNGILSDDAGQGCSDGLYERVYGSARTYRRSVTVRSSPRSSYSGGSGNSMVNTNCESGGRTQVRSPDGKYWGLFQFDYATWVAHGGSPSSYGNAGAAEQSAVASRVTYDAWPNC